MYKWANYIIIFSLLFSCINSQEDENDLTDKINSTCTIDENCDYCYFCGNLTEDYSICNYENIFCHHIEDNKYEYNTGFKDKYSNYFRSNSEMDAFCGTKNYNLKSAKKSFKILETKFDNNLLLTPIHCDYELTNKYYYDHEADEATITLKINNINQDENNQIKFNLFMIYQSRNTLRFLNLNDSSIRNRPYNKSLLSISELEILIDIKNDINNFFSIEESLEISILTNNPSRKTRIIIIIAIVVCVFLALLIIVLIIIYIYVKRKMEREFEENRNNERIEKEKKIEENKKLIITLFETKLKKTIIEKNKIVNDCESCSICLESFEYGVSEVSITPCNHIFHFECLKKWVNDNVLNPKCPNCNYALLEFSSNSKLNLNLRNNEINSNGNNENANSNDNNTDLRRSENIIIRRNNNNNGQIENGENGNSNNNN